MSADREGPVMKLSVRGAWPLPLAGEYPRDDAHLAEYVALAASEEGFRHYLDRYVYARKAA